MSIEAELAPLCDEPVTQKLVAQVVGDLCALDNDTLVKMTGDLAGVRAKIIVNDPDLGGAPLHLNRVRIVEALTELVRSVYVVPRDSR